MSFLSFGKKSTRVTAVAFAGSASAGCALLAHSKSDQTRVLAYDYATLPVQSGTAVTADAVAALIQQVCDASAKKYAESSVFKEFGRVHESFGIIHAPWATSKSAHVERLFQKQTSVTDALIGEMAQEALSHIELQGPLFESTVVRIELNGYPTSVPRGRKVTRMAVSALASTADATIVSGLTNALQRAFPVQHTLRSDARVLAQLGAEETEKIHNCFVVHVTNEATLCVAIRKGVPAEIGVADVGTRTLARAVGDGEDAMTLLRLATRDACQDDTCRAVETALAQAEPELAKKYGEVFASLSKVRRLPDTLLLIVHPDFTPWFTSFFARLDFAPFTIPSKPFQVLTPSSLQQFKNVVWSAGLKEELSLIEAVAFVNSQEE